MSKKDVKDVSDLIRKKL